MKPLVSVMMLTMNSREDLERSIPSILNQTYSNFELLIVDGGSTDGTLKYCEKIDDERVRILDGSERVPSRNLAIQESNGKYIAVADSDTVSSCERLEKQVNFLECNLDYDVVGSNTKRISESGKEKIERKPITHQSIKMRSVYQFPMVHSTMVFRSSVFDTVGAYRSFRWEDYELLTRLIGEGIKVSNIDEVLVECYMREDGVTGSTSQIEMGIASLACRMLAIYRYDFSLSTKIALFMKTLVDILKKSKNILSF